MDVVPLLTWLPWILLAGMAWWIGAVASAVRRDLLGLEQGGAVGDADYAVIARLQRLRDDPVHLGLRLRFSRVLAAALVPACLAVGVASLGSVSLGVLAGSVGWLLASMAEASGGGASVRRFSRARGGAGYAVWAKLTQPAARLARPGLHLRRLPETAEESAAHVLAESQAAATPAGGRLGFVERRFLRRLLAGASIPVSDIMTPWERVRRLEIGMDLAETTRQVQDSGHSRHPVMDAGRVVGLVTVKDLLLAGGRPEPIPLADLLRPVYYVRRQATMSELMNELQEARVHLAVAVDALGRPVGLVTMEDVLEEIVGELYDEREKDGGTGR